MTDKERVLSLLNDLHIGYEKYEDERHGKMSERFDCIEGMKNISAYQGFRFSWFFDEHGKFITNHVIPHGFTNSHQIYWVEAAKQKHGAWFRPTGHAVHQPTHWMSLPSAEAIEKGGV